MKRKKRKNTQLSNDLKSSSTELVWQLETRRKYADILLFFLLLSFGIFHSVIYWGHQVVPHFDFGCFAGLGRQVLSFKLPTDYKRVPLVGILQVLLGYIAGGAYPDFHGGWLLNSIVHPLIAVLLWLAGRKVIGRAAVWFAIIAIINPWGLSLLTEAIAETTLLFFIWATFYLIFIRSKWAYLLASLTTMVRYEGAALILGAFVMDMIDSEDKKQRIIAFVYAVLASAPLALWMLGTVMSWQAAGATHYLKIFTEEYTSQFVEDVESKTGFSNNALMLWKVGFYPLLMLPRAGETFMRIHIILIQIFTLISFLFGSVYGLYKRQWKILVLLIFLLPYFWIHAKYPYLIARYHASIFAIVMLICIYGLYSFWTLINSKVRFPKWTVIIAQLAVLITAIIWAMALWSYLPKTASVSKASVSLPYVAILVAGIAFATEVFAYKGNLLTNFVVLILMVLMIVSNQFIVARVVGNGERDTEFKHLIDWYCENAQKGEKLVTTAPSILQIMAPQYKDCFIHTSTFDANSPTEFVYECYKRNITYVAWDSRMGLATASPYYKYWKMSNIAPLGSGKNLGPYQLITQLKADRREYRKEGEYINLYRLRYPPPESK